ncbi:MAG: hypothetical protein WC374_04105 [Phycisphaerae bacterium]|jgi:hypothetical protein
MSKNDISSYQRGVINNYYANLDGIMLQRLGEMVTELYLAETDAKKNRLWERVHKSMQNLKIPPAIIEHIMNKRDVQILAKNLNDWQSSKKRK